jgi:hypothetical protein
MIGGAFVTVFGISLIVITLKLTPAASGLLLLVAGSLFAALGCMAICGSFVTNGILAYVNIRIDRLGPMSVTLTNVAPEFVEAYRVHLANGTERAAFRGPAAEDVAHDGPPPAEEMIQVLHVAEQEARALGQDYLGTKHLLLALRLTPTTAVSAFQALGLSAEQLLREACWAAVLVVRRMPETSALPATPAVRRALAAAGAEAQALNQPAVRAGHLLLAMLREPENEAVQLLLNLGIPPEEARRRVVDAIGLLEGMITKGEFEARQGMTSGGRGENRFAGG